MKPPRNEPARCSCMSGEDGLSTHRAARHFSRCHHSTLRATTQKHRGVPKLRPVPGTRRVTVILDGGR
jgi:hypothetical protein